MINTFDTINDRPIFWTDKAGVTHRCEGADVHRDVRLLWTKCERDVPADAAFSTVRRRSCNVPEVPADR